MGYVLGVDLGTTWTAAATVADGKPPVPVELGESGTSMPSIVARKGDGLVVGDEAERLIAADPTCGAREVKRRLGDAAPFVLSGTPYGAEALMGALLAHVVQRAMAANGGASPDTVVLTHPANWGEFKLDLLRNAGKVAGLESVALITEPQAAALHHTSSTKDIAAGATIAVYDFGGGTFDATVVAVGPDGGHLVGTPEGLERLGGIDLDAAVLAHVNAALDGQLSEVDRKDPETHAGLSALRAEATHAKEELSTSTETTIDVALPTIATQVRLTRTELESMIRPRIADTTGALARAVRATGTNVDTLACILLVGGSSRIPMVAEQITAQTGRPATAVDQPKLAVAMGATRAIAAQAVAAATATVAPLVETAAKLAVGTAAAAGAAAVVGAAAAHATAASPAPDAPTAPGDQGTGDAIDDSVAAEADAPSAKADAASAKAETAKAKAEAKAKADLEKAAAKAKATAEKKAKKEAKDGPGIGKRVAQGAAAAAVIGGVAAAGVTAAAALSDDDPDDGSSSMDALDDLAPPPPVETPPAADPAAAEAIVGDDGGGGGGLGGGIAAGAGGGGGGPAPAAHAGGPAPAAHSGGAAAAVRHADAPTAPAAAESHAEAAAPAAPPAPAPASDPTAPATGGGTPTTPAGTDTPSAPAGTDMPPTDTTMADPIADVRTELADTLENWTPPEGMDPAEAEVLRSQLQASVADYQPAAGESPADASEAIIRQLQQEMATYADEHGGTDPSIPLPDTTMADPIADVRTELADTLENWTPPEGMDPAEAEVLRSQLQASVVDYQPAAGESPADASEAIIRQLQQEMATYADEHGGTDPSIPLPDATMDGGPDALQDVRDELYNTVAEWDPPDNMDPAEAETLRGEMQHAIATYEPTPGESPADATEAILGQVQQRLADHMIDDDPGAMPPDPAVEADALRAEIDGLDPANPFDADQIDDLQARLAALDAPAADIGPDPTVDPPTVEGMMPDTGTPVSADSGFADAFDDPDAMRMPLTADAFDDNVAMSATALGDDMLDDDVLGTSFAHVPDDLAAPAAAMSVDDLPSVPELPQVPEFASAVDMGDADLAALPDMPELPSIDTFDDEFATNGFDDDVADLDEPMDLTTPDA